MAVVDSSKDVVSHRQRNDNLAAFDLEALTLAEFVSDGEQLSKCGINLCDSGRSSGHRVDKDSIQDLVFVSLYNDFLRSPVRDWPSCPD